MPSEPSLQPQRVFFLFVFVGGESPHSRGKGRRAGGSSHVFSPSEGCIVRTLLKKQNLIPFKVIVTNRYIIFYISIHYKPVINYKIRQASVMNIVRGGPTCLSHPASG